MISVVFSVVHRFLRVSQRNSVTIRIDQIKTLYFIVFLLAFLPPEPTYSLIATDNPPAVNGTTDQNTPNKTTSVVPSTAQRYQILFSEKAEWQHSANELTKLEPYYVQTSRHNRIACLYINCTTNPKYYILFSHGNAVDLGKYSQISLQCIFCSSQDKWPVSLLFWAHVYNVISSVMIIPAMVFRKAMQVKKICMRILKQRTILSNNDFTYLHRK